VKQKSRQQECGVSWCWNLERIKGEGLADARPLPWLLYCVRAIEDTEIDYRRSLKRIYYSSVLVSVGVKHHVPRLSRPSITPLNDKLSHVITTRYLRGLISSFIGTHNQPCRHSSACKDFFYHPESRNILTFRQRQDTHFQATPRCTRGYQAIPAEEICRSDPSASPNARSSTPRTDFPKGSGNLRLAVKLPEGEDLNEWLAVHGESGSSRSPLLRSMA
jgi:Mob1/phocein family